MKNKGNGKRNFISGFHTIRSAVLGSYFLIAVLALSVFALVAFRYTEKTVMENAREYSGQLIEQVNSDIDSYVDYLRNISTMITSDRDVHDYLWGEHQTPEEMEEQRNRITAQFQTILETRNDIVNIGILGMDGRYLINNGYYRVNENVTLEELPWIQKVLEKKGVTVISSSHVQNVVDGKYEWVITLGKVLGKREMGEAQGIFFVDLNYSSISELCSSISFGNKGYIFILDEDGNLIYHPQQQLLYSGLKTEKIERVMESRDDSFFTEDGKLYSISKSRDTGWTVVGVSYTEDLLKNSNETTRIYLSSALIIFAAAFVLAYVLSREITRPIEVLGESMREAEKGNFENVTLEIEGNNEIARLSATFNIMIREIKQLMEQNVEEQRQKRKSELKALQAQINPHFLYNTLDSIIWMAEWGKTREVVLMTSSLAKLLRQSISNQNELVRVEEEIGYTNSYLTIQKMRYKDKLEYEVQVSPEVLDRKIPKLVLQPLVENAIYHGIKYKEGKGTVLIEGKRRDRELILKVSDDGVGMTKEQLSKIFEKRETDIRKNGVGVQNVHERIQLYYGKEYGLVYTSRYGAGTTVEIRIPWMEGGSEADHEKNI